jgi:NADH dehydrogenase
VISAVQGFAGPGDVSPETVDRGGNDNLIQASERAGVSRFILLSIAGAQADSPMSLFRAKHHAEGRLRASSLSWTVVRPTAYMETWAEILGGMLRERGRMLVFGRGENPISFVSVADVAALVERAATDPDLAGRVLVLSGPDDMTFNKFAATVQNVAGIDGRVAHVPRGMLRAMSVVMRPFKPQLARMARASVVMDTRDMSFDGSEARREFPDLPCTDLSTALQRG